MINKKILILGSNEYFSIEKMYERAFKKLGFKVNLLHTYNIQKGLIFRFIWKYFRFIHFIFIRKKIIKNIVNSNKKYDLIIIFKGIYIDEDFFSVIKKKYNNSKIIDIFPDDPFQINYFKDISNVNILKTIPYFDHVFIYSKVILKKLKKKYPKNRFSYLPFGYDSVIQKNLKKKSNNIVKYDISFIGTADDERYKIIKRLNEFKIILAGNGWNNYELGKNITYVKEVNFKNFSKLLKTSKVSLNILRKQNKNSHNMKTFEIPSMGGLMITNRTFEQNFYFPENKASLMYGDIKELKLKIRKINNSYKKNNKIQKRSYAIVKKHSYIERVKYLLKKIYE
jgi:spore maturation protein CgeB